MVDSFVDTPNLKKMGPRDGCGRALDTALDDMCSFAPVRGDDQSEAYVMIDKAIELVVDDAHVEKMEHGLKGRGAPGGRFEARGLGARAAAT